MGRHKNTNLVDAVKNIVSAKKAPEVKKQESKKVIEKPVKEVIETPVTIEETVQKEESVKEEIISKKEESTKEIIEKQQETTTEETPQQFVEEVVYTNDNQPKDTTNFKPVQVIKDSELEYLRKRSEVIVRLKQDPKYKFLSKVALIKIADIYMQKNY